MNFNDWQDLWQQQPAGPAAADLATTIRRVRAGARAFDRTILWRDLREGIAALVVSLVFANVARARALEGAPAWDAWLAAAVPVAVAAFLFADRFAARRRRPQGDGSLLAEIDGALAELRHQRALLANVFWWYLLPLAVSAGLMMARAVFMVSTVPEVRLLFVAVVLLIIVGVDYPIWRLNRRAVVREIQPRIEQLEHERRELLAAEFSS